MGEFNISYYIFEKDNTFLDWLGKLLTEVFEIQDGEKLAEFIIKRKECHYNSTFCFLYT